jgi:hypothetical protein
MMKYMFWDNLNSWLYSIISMMFKNLCMSKMCWIDLKCVSVYCGWDLNYVKLFENMSCWNCLCFMKKLCFEWFQSV